MPSRKEGTGRHCRAGDFGGPYSRVLQRELQSGYFERVRVDRGEIVLDPKLASVRQVKFGSADRAMSDPPQFQLKPFEIRYGLPLVAEFEHAAEVPRC